MSAKRMPLSSLAVRDWCLNGWTALVFVFLYAPIVVLVAYSFNASRLNIVWTGFTLKWFQQLFANAPLMRALQPSFVIA